MTEQRNLFSFETEDSRAEAKIVLKNVFGHSSFRGLQEDIVSHVASGGDGLVLMPTGGGKSLCYQVPGLVREGTAVVISPLISLMQDQVQTLCELGLNAYAYNSSMGLREKRQVEKELLAGDVDFLYLAPERLMTHGCLELLEEMDIKNQLSLFAIDEAHCVSKWGHDFRPEYRKLAILAKRFPSIPRIALTATADKHTRADIIRELSLEKARVFLGSFDRPNIYYSLTKRERQGSEQLLNFLEGREEQCGIIYCLSRRKVEETALFLQSKGFPAKPYHAGLDKEVRRAHQEEFLINENQIIVATVAFGMGIDKPNVRYVVHMDLPKNMENYYQETGRAGRDGLESEVQLFYGKRDLVILKQMMRKNARTPERFHFEVENLETMLGFAETTACRRQAILQGFDEDFRGPCGNCDNCLNEPYGFEARDWALRLLVLYYRSKILQNVQDLCDLARGIVSLRTREKKWFELPDFGFLMDTPEKGVLYGIRQLIAHGFLKHDWTKNGLLQLTPLALDFIKIERPLVFRDDPKKVEKKTAKSTATKKETPVKKKRKKATRKKVNSAPKKTTYTNPSLDQKGQDLYLALKELRSKESKKRKLPAFKIFHDQTLIEMAQNRPVCAEDFIELYGVGQAKLKKYGKTFMKVIESYC